MNQEKYLNFISMSIVFAKLLANFNNAKNDKMNFQSNIVEIRANFLSCSDICRSRAKLKIFWLKLVTIFDLNSLILA